MYRIFCESYDNYISQYYNMSSQNEYRYKIAKPIELITDIEKYKIARRENTLEYKVLSDLLFFMKEHISEYPKFKAFLWTLESRGIKACYFGVVSQEDLIEQAKLINMFLNLLYWEKPQC